MINPPEEFDSVFRYIVVVSQRAEQLIHGARVRSESRHTKPTLAAKDDVDEGLVHWRILTQEELDAQRQAVVDELRAQVGGDEAEGVPAEVRDVLPTGGAPAPPPEEGEEERDVELARLQRLLGMSPETASEVASEEESGEDADEDAGDEGEGGGEGLDLDEAGDGDGGDEELDLSGEYGGDDGDQED